MAEEVKGSSSSSSNSSSSSFRWNPTKEQLAILEGIYREGIRTPNAEQIQEITGRLRAFGEIEGKNVFYWFQNHKARQRQKMIKHHERKNIAIPTRLRHPQQHYPLSPPPPPFSPAQTHVPNVVYGPYGLQPAVVAQPPAGASSGFYYQIPPSTSRPSVYLPPAGGGAHAPVVRMMQISTKLDIESTPSSYGCCSVHYSHDRTAASVPPMNETLQLFPLHPLLQEEEEEEERSGRTSLTTSAASAVVLEEGQGEGDGGCNQIIPFFNFFSPPPPPPETN